MLKVPTAIVAKRAERIVVRTPGYGSQSAPTGAARTPKCEPQPAQSGDLRPSRARLSPEPTADETLEQPGLSEEETVVEEEEAVEFEPPDAGQWEAKVAARRKEKIRDGEGIRARTEYSLTLAVMFVVALVGYQTMGHRIVAALARIVSAV